MSAYAPSPASSVSTTPLASSPYNSAIPGVSSYMGADASAVKAYNDALVKINSQRQNLLSQNGYAADIDPTNGTIKNLRVDPYNNYGNFQQLLNNQGFEDIATHDASAGRGFTGGLANQPEAQLQYAHNAARTSFGSNLMGQFGSYDSQQADAAQTRDAALWQAQLSAMLNAVANGNFNPASFTPDPTTDPSGPSASAKSKNLFGRTDPAIAAAMLKRGANPTKAIVKPVTKKKGGK